MSMMLQSATFENMPTISQRELRNDNAEIIRGVERGETYVVTKRGVPVARLVPYAPETDLKVGRPATERRPFSGRARPVPSAPTSEILDDLRSGDR